MLKMRLKRCFFLLLPVLFLLINASKVRALDYAGLSVSPPTFELSANPGDSLSNTIKVQNLSDESIRVVVDRRNFTAVGEEGSVDLTAEASSFSLASWMSVFPTETEISPQGIKIFTFWINAPLNAEPGGHFGSIVFRIAGQGQMRQTGASVAQELATLVLLRVAGKTTEQLNLESFSPQRKLLEYGPVELVFRLRNQGNVHLKPRGTVTVTNLFGQKVAVLEIEPKNVIPGAIRKNSVFWDKKLLFGRYQAIISLAYGTQGKVLTGSTVFWGFPYRIGIPILIVFLILLLLVIRGRKRLKLAIRVLLSGR